MKVILMVAFTCQSYLCFCNFISTPILPPDRSYRRNLTYQDSIQIPFTHSRHLILIEGTIDEQSGYWILDTGAPKIVVNERFAHDVWTSENISWTDVSGKSAPSKNTYVRNISVGSVRLNKAGVYVSNLTSIESEREVNILGLLGLEFLLRYNIQIDSRRNMLTLYKRNFPFHRSPLSPQVNITFSRQSYKMFLKAKFNGKKHKMIFDTGAEACLINRRFINRLGNGFSLQRYSKVLTSQSATLSSQDGMITNVEIGDLRFPSLRVLAIDNDHNVDGMIGYDLLKLGVVNIDFNKNELIIIPYPSEDVLLAETKKATR